MLCDVPLQTTRELGWLDKARIPFERVGRERTRVMD